MFSLQDVWHKRVEASAPGQMAASRARGWEHNTRTHTAAWPEARAGPTALPLAELRCCRHHKQHTHSWQQQDESQATYSTGYHALYPIAAAAGTAPAADDDQECRCTPGRRGSCSCTPPAGSSRPWPQNNQHAPSRHVCPAQKRAHVPLLAPRHRGFPGTHTPPTRTLACSTCTHTRAARQSHTGTGLEKSHTHARTRHSLTAG